MSKRMTDDEFKTAFYRRIERGNAGECWPWNGGHFSDGSAAVSRHGRMIPAARLLLGFERPRTESHQMIVGELFAIHSCRNSGCMNPAHLEWGKKGRKRKIAPYI